MDNFKKAFTLVELIVVITIISILSAIGFTSYINNIADSRDGQRKSDFAEINSALKSYKLKKGSYPIPNGFFEITNGGDAEDKVVAWQGKLTKEVGLSTLEEIPYDPKLKIPYFYSFTKNRQEYEIATTLENDNNEIALLKGDYKSVAKNVLPTIILALLSSSSVEIRDGVGSGDNTGAENRKFFVFDGLGHNLVYSFENGTSPISDGTDFDTLLSEAEENKTFFQNSSFETCDEIKESGKFIGNGQYQVRTQTGSLTNTGCTS